MLYRAVIVKICYRYVVARSSVRYPWSLVLEVEQGPNTRRPTKQLSVPEHRLLFKLILKEGHWTAARHKIQVLTSSFVRLRREVVNAGVSNARIFDAKGPLGVGRVEC